MDYSNWGKMLLGVAALLAVIGFLFLGLGSLVGRLPGDFHWQRGNFNVYLPLASSLLISIVLTVLLNLFFRR